MMAAAETLEESAPLAPGFTILRLSADDAGPAWDKVAPLLYSAIAQSGGLYHPDDVRELVTTPGPWSLWILVEGATPLAAWVTRLHAYPRGSALETIFAGGRGMERWYDFALAETEKFARELGCAALRCGGRRGWERHGYRLLGHLFERKLQ